MPSRLNNEIRLGHYGYQLWEDVDHVASPKDDIELDSSEYFAWLSTLRSFHFEGKEGRFTARLEKRKNKDGSTREYWSAYRKFNKKQLRRYLGTTDKLTIAILEEAARHLTNKCTTPKMKTQRKSPEKREILYARIAMNDKAIVERNTSIEQLHKQLEEKDRIIEDQKARIHHLEISLKIKRESLEL
jgi:hypothetical protein